MAGAQTAPQLPTAHRPVRPTEQGASGQGSHQWAFQEGAAEMARCRGAGVRRLTYPSGNTSPSAGACYSAGAWDELPNSQSPSVTVYE